MTRKQTTLMDQSMDTTKDPFQHITPAVTDETRRDRGFTLVEILIAIVLVGILSAVVVVGIGNLTSKGTDAACTASLDAAKSATVVYYGSNSNAWPATMAEMTGSSPAALSLPTGVTLDVTGLIATGSGWTLTMTPSAGGNQPTFACT
jgi:prepilin-type N-terminal cleavage/methylation domain-containing protein